jgi:NAD-dependent SIR2 family protein deacetylase
MSSTCPSSLKALYREGRILPFIGAGVSMSVRWTTPDGKERRGPSWDELIDEAARILGYEEPQLLRMRGQSLQILEYFGAKKGDMQPLINWLHIRLQPDDASVLKSKIHAGLAKLEQCRTFYTTNYDDFLERSFELNGRPIQRIAGERDMGRSGSKTEIVKFHGDFNTPTRMVMSEQHYEERIRLEEPLDLRLRADALGRAILFLGYSFRDSNVSYLFRRIVDSFGPLPDAGTGMRAYIIVREPSDFELRLFQRRRIEVIAVHGEDFETKIAEILDDMRS